MKCVFCDREGDTKHHILPKRVRRIVSWNGKRARQSNANKKINICVECHQKLNSLQMPLIRIIECLVLARVPDNFAQLMDEVYEKLAKNIIV